MLNITPIKMARIFMLKSRENANFQLAGNTADAIERATLLTNDENKRHYYNNKHLLFGNNNKNLLKILYILVKTGKVIQRVIEMI